MRSLCLNTTIAVLAATVLLVSGCGSVHSGRKLVSATAPLGPVYEPPSARGNPQHYKVFGKRYWVRQTSVGYRERGLASWYGLKFHGRPTSSGEPYDMYAVSAAHKTLPIPTYIRVTRLDNGASLVVRVNDRGPFVDSRVVDLSYAAAVQLDMVDLGTVEVEVEALPPYQSLTGLGNNTFSATRPRQAAAHGSSPASYFPTPLAPARPGTEGRTVYLQIGAFASVSRARRLQSRLRAHIEHTVAIESSAEYGVHRVKIGPLPDAATVSGLKQRLNAIGISESLLVVK